MRPSIHQFWSPFLKISSFVSGQRGVEPVNVQKANDFPLLPLRWKNQRLWGTYVAWNPNKRLYLYDKGFQNLMHFLTFSKKRNHYSLSEKSCWVSKSINQLCCRFLWFQEILFLLTELFRRNILGQGHQTQQNECKYNDIVWSKLRAGLRDSVDKQKINLT